MKLTGLVGIGMGLVLAMVGMRGEAANALEGQWDEQFGFPDFNRTVYAVAVAPSGVYVGGAFGGNPQWLRLERMARWDGQAWSGLGGAGQVNGASDAVRAMAVMGDDIYLAGEFPAVIDDTLSSYSVNSIVRYDGANWHRVGTDLGYGLVGQVYALAADGTNLYAGGRFYAAGGQSATSVARWDGVEWSAMGDGLGDPDGELVTALAVGQDGVVYAGGTFTRSGEVPVRRLARWDGAGWTEVGGGVDGQVHALAVWEGELHVGGTFSEVGGNLIPRFARWDGESWWEVGGGIRGGNVFVISETDHDLIVGGSFTDAGTVAANGIARWDGTTWASFGEGMSGGDPTAVHAVAVDGDIVYAVGDFLRAGGVSASRVARWDGVRWSKLTLALGHPDRVTAIAIGKEAVYVGGVFPSAGGAPANNIAGWTGLEWKPLGSGLDVGLDGAVDAIAVDSQERVFAGGQFSKAGGVAVGHLAWWDGKTWAPMGAGVSPGGRVLAMAVGPDDSIYAGGFFEKIGDVPVSNLARWDGTQWHDVGGGVAGGLVETLVIRGNEVWVGGAFESAGGVAAPGIARWDGAEWSSLGTGIWNLGQRAAVHDMLFVGDELFVGGEFRYAGGLLVNHVARWDGQGWHALGPGLEGQVNALAFLRDRLFVGGKYSKAGDESITDLAAWDGAAWSTVGGGLGGWPTDVLALASHRTNLYVGGLFSWAGEMGASRFARWSIAHEPPWVTIVEPGGGAAFEMGDDIRIRAESLAGDSPVASMEFRANGVLLGTLDSAPYELWWLDVFPGEYELTVEATDMLGVSSVSVPVTIEVLTHPDNLPPEVYLLHPEEDLVLHADESGVWLEAEAADPDGTILRVDFYANGRWLDTVASAPYSFLWTDLEPGVFLVWARATDNLGGRSDSEPVQVTVLPPNQAPVVTWLEPEDSSFHSVPGGIRLSAMATDSDGDVARLEFLANDRLLASLPGAGPFEFEWLDAEPGYYVLTALATDDGGRSAGRSLVILAVDANAPPVTRTTPLDEPRLDFWVPDGQVNAVVETDGIVYIGGAFNHIGQQVPGSAVLELTADTIDLSYPLVDGLVSVIYPDGEGGYYVGGLFNAIGGIARTNLARVRADKTVDLDFEAHTSGYVLAFALQGDELLVGGEFSRIHGVDRWGLASVNRLTGELSDWDPGVNSHVNTLLIADDRLYVGGQFNQIGGQPQANLAALDLETRSVLPWNPIVDGSVTQIVPSGDLVYLVGSFFHVNQARRNGLAAVTRDTGETTSFNHLAQSRAHQLLVAGGLVYVAGGFNRIAGVDRNNLAAIDPVTGQATDWHPNVDGTITAMALKGDTLFIAGSFGAVGGVPRFRLAGVTTNMPPVVTDLDLNASGRIFALGEVNGKILGGGPLGLVRIHRPALAALDVVTGAATAWEPGCNGTVHSLAVADGRLLVGGAFSELKGRTRHGLGAFDLATGDLLDWNPMVGGAALALAVRDRTVHVGGAFVEFGGQPRHHLAAVDLLSGELTPWNPQSNEQVTAIALGDGIAYAGGYFNRIGGLTRRHLAALDLDTGLATAWDPNPDLPVLTITVEHDTVYVGGAFRTVGGRTRNSLAALDAQSGQATPWAAYPDSSVMAIVSANHLLYVGGGFEEIGGRLRPALAALNPRVQTPNALDWTPAPWSDLQPATIRALAASSSALFVGGRFEVAGGEPRSNFAVFDLPTRIDQATMPGDGVFRLNLVGPLGRVYVFEASTNLVDWSPILTNRAPFLVEDREALTMPRRFYRAVPAR